MKKILFIILLINLSICSFSQKKIITFNGHIVTFQKYIVTQDIYNPLAKAFFNRLTYNFDKYTKQIISSWFDTMQYYDIYNKLDSRYFFAFENETDALIDWIRYDVSAITINNPYFEKYIGYSSNGTSSYLKINYNPEIDANNFTLTNGSISFHINTNNITASDWPWGIRDVSNGLAMRSESTNELYYFNRLSAAASFAHNSDISGYTIISRNDNAVYLKRRNSGYQSQSYSYVGIPNQSNGIYIGALNNQGTASNFDTNQYCIFNISGYLDGTQAKKLYEADSILLAHFQEPLIIIAGQSNAAGRAYDNVDSVDNPSYLNTPSNVYYMINDAEGDDNFTDLVIGTNSSDWGGRFGLEASYMHNLINDRELIYLAKCAHGGSPIRYFMSGGQYHNELINTINNAISKSGKKSIEFIWYQGENDWYEQSTTYYNDLTIFFNQLRDQVNADILRVIICEIRYDVYPEFTDVLDDIKQYVNENDNVYYMTTSELGKLDHTHVNSQGMIDLGVKFFNKQYTETTP